MGRALSLPISRHPQGGLVASPTSLLRLGHNMQVEVGTASALVSPGAPRRSATLFAHLDTGANQTTISSVLAAHLGLVQMGVATSHTANGPASNPTYAIDLVFIGTTLSPWIDLNVGSCVLPFDLATLTTNPNDLRNIGLLVGRDVMSRWHMAWDGPSSMVVITD